MPFRISSSYRSLLLALAVLALVAVHISGAQTQQNFGKPFEDVIQAIGTTLASFGVLGRLLTAGWRDARREQSGPYSVVRHPLIVCDFFILLGLSMSTQVWWFVAVAVLCFAFRLRGNLVGNATLNNEIPAIVPDMTQWTMPASPFSWRLALSREFGAIYLVIVCTVMLEIGVDLRTGHASLNFWPPDWPSYFLALAVATGLYPIAVGLADERPARKVTGPQTRGLRVDGRAKLVDTLENMISAGNLEHILYATLDAAEIGAGDSLVDIGCGSGKLAIAAAKRIGANGQAAGIDATPGMIDIARQNAKAARSDAKFHVGIAESLPFADGSVAAVTSSYFFHHLPGDVKPLALMEMWRVLAPGGRLIITDYGHPRSIHGYVASFPMRLDFHEFVRPQVRGELDRMIAAAGIGEPEVVRTFLGYISVLRIVKR
jgi:ubiquinone/menaquinone biosynthesis C-methylase UbiE